jgi:acylphosphatase
MAMEVGVTGWCRNLPDGRVEAAFEGEPAAVERALAWIRHGPAHARVTATSVVDEPTEGATGFWLG